MLSFAFTVCPEVLVKEEISMNNGNSIRILLTVGWIFISGKIFANVPTPLRSAGQLFYVAPGDGC
jgi:hypothetical protein